LFELQLDENRSAFALWQGTTSAAPQNLRNISGLTGLEKALNQVEYCVRARLKRLGKSLALYQGTTSVVPQVP
jgi:hypothetical protein